MDNIFIAKNNLFFSVDWYELRRFLDAYAHQAVEKKLYLPLDMAARNYWRSLLSLMREHYVHGFRAAALVPSELMLERELNERVPAFPLERLDKLALKPIGVYYAPARMDAPNAVRTHLAETPYVVFRIVLAVTAMDDIAVCKRVLRAVESRRYSRNQPFLSLVSECYSLLESFELCRSRLILENFRAKSSASRFRAICRKRLARHNAKQAALAAAVSSVDFLN